MTTKGFDGAIKIDTSIEDKNFNVGLKKIGASLGKVGKAIGGMTLTAAVGLTGAAVAAGVVLKSVVSLGIGFAKLGVNLVKFGLQLIETMADSVDKTTDLGKTLASLTESFNNVKGALYSVAATILTAVQPYIEKIVDWLIKALNYVSMFVAVWLGKKSAYQYIAGSLEDSAKSSKKLADNAKKTEKAAKGALAAFDDLNVLAKDTAETTAPSPDTGGGGMAFVETPVSPEIITQVEEVKERIHVVWGEIGEFLKDPFQYIANWIYEHVNRPIEEFFKNTWANIKQWAIDLWDRVLENWETVKTRVKEQIIEPIKETFSGMWADIKQWAMDVWAGVIESWEIFKTRIKEQIIEPIKKGFSEAWADVKQWTEDTWDNIQLAWKGAGDWFRDNVTDPVKNWFSQALKDVRQFFSDAWNGIVEKWGQLKDWFKTHVTDPIKGFFSGSLDDVKGFFSEAWENIKNMWSGIGTWITEHVTEPIKNAFDTALAWVKDKWENVFSGLGDFLKGIVNGIIGFINGMIWGFTEGINAIVGALNSLSITIPEWVPGIGGNSFGVNLPYAYAPQIPYLATGAVIPPNSEFLAMLGDNKTQREILAPEDLIRQIIREENQGPKEIIIKFEGNLGQLVRELKPYIDQENVRIGKSLVSGRLAT